MYLHTFAHPVRADTIRHQRIHARCADRTRMAGKHQQLSSTPKNGVEPKSQEPEEPTPKEQDKVAKGQRGRGVERAAAKSSMRASGSQAKPVWGNPVF